MSQSTKIVDDVQTEHDQISADFDELSKLSRDIEAEAIRDTGSAQETLVPRALDGQYQSLRTWKARLDALAESLREHFKREETVLMDVFERSRNDELIHGLEELLKEHQSLLDEIDGCRRMAEDLVSGGSRIVVWEGSGWGMKHNIERLQQHVAEHTEQEHDLFERLKSHLSSREQSP
ncbi:MAG: hemerythrin domain-containing protein [Chloroflexota bacterium]